jgi:hypothetical protein
MSENFKYDAFIAYAGPDAEYARKLYTLLTVIGNRVFLAPDLVNPGELWQAKIKQAQKGSLLTVVLISNHSDSSYFQKVEILRAIELARDEHHRVVPVYLTDIQVGGDALPDELRQIQGVLLKEGPSLLYVAQQIEASIETSRRREEWQHDIDRATIVIVTGCHHLPEIYDRASAYELKEAIDNLAHSLRKTFLNSVVMGDIWIQRYSSITGHPNLISIGSPGVNSMTGQIAEQGNVLRIGPDDRWRIVRSLNRWALYGNLAEDTHAAVISFKKLDLPAFLREVWSN